MTGEAVVLNPGEVQGLRGIAGLVKTAAGLRAGGIASVFAEKRRGLRVMWLLKRPPLVQLILLEGASVTLSTAASAVAGADGKPAEPAWVAWADCRGQTGLDGAPPEREGAGLTSLAREALTAAGPELASRELRTWPSPGDLDPLLFGLVARLAAGRRGSLEFLLVMEAWDQAAVAAGPGSPPAADTRWASFGVLAALLDRDGEVSLGVAPCVPPAASREAFAEAILRAGAEAVERAEQTLGAIVPEPGVYDTVWESLPAAGVVHEGLGHPLEARHGPAAVLAGKEGCRVGSEDLTVTEDPTCRAASGSYSVDDEGVPSRRTVLIENGILRGYLHDRGTALAAGVAPNGHGRRGSFKVPAMARMGCTMALGGSLDQEELIARVGDGLLITMGMSGRSAVYSGSFRLIVTEGRMIRGGKLGPLVKNFLVKADILNSLRGYRAAAPVPPPLPGDCGLRPEQMIMVSMAAPALLLPEVTVARALTADDVRSLFRDPRYSNQLLDQI